MTIGDVRLYRGVGCGEDRAPATTDDPHVDLYLVRHWCRAACASRACALCDVRGGVRVEVVESGGECAGDVVADGAVWSTGDIGCMQGGLETARAQGAAIRGCGVYNTPVVQVLDSANR